MAAERKDQIREFLELLWEGKDDEDWLAIWTEGGKTYWSQEIDDLVEYGVTQQGNTYLNVAAHDAPRHLENDPNKGFRRGKAEEATVIPGLWMDIDYQSGEAHKGESLPPNEAAAREVLESIGAPPSVLVHSGHGLQAWWLFKEPQRLLTDADRREAAEYSKLWQKAIQALMAAKGWASDYTGDLARILRLPGTYNVKAGGKVQARIVGTSNFRFVDYEDVEKYLPEGPPEIAGTPVVLAESGDAKEWSHYERVMGGVQEGSRNNDITSLAGLLVRNLLDLDDSKALRLAIETLNLVNEKFDPPLDAAEVRRTFYSVRNLEIARREKEMLEADIIERHAEAISDTAPPSDEVVQQLVKNFGGLPIRRVLKHGKADSDYFFVIATDQGEETVSLGKALANQGEIRMALLNATRGKWHLRRYKGPEWDTVVRKIAMAAEEVTFADEDTTAILNVLLERYVQDSTVFRGDDWGAALSEFEPFLREGRLWVSGENVLTYASLHRVKITRRQLFSALHADGWSRHKRVSSYSEGKRFQRRYWCKPIDAIDWAIAAYNRDEETRDVAPEAEIEPDGDDWPDTPGKGDTPPATGQSGKGEASDTSFDTKAFDGQSGGGSGDSKRSTGEYEAGVTEPGDDQ